MRKGLKTRILFRWEKDWIEFILAGDHNDIKRFLKGGLIQILGTVLYLV